MKLKRAAFCLVILILAVLVFLSVCLLEEAAGAEFRQFAGTKIGIEEILKNKLGADVEKIKMPSGKTMKDAISETLSDPRVFVDMKIFKKLNEKGPGYFSEEAGLFSRQSILDGVVFLNKNSAFISRVEKQYGVEREALAGIFRIESDFGRKPGEFSVLNALLTFSALKNHRFKSADKNLAGLFLVCAQHGLDIFKLTGSWAGAFGYCQFMPLSYVYAVDGNGDKRIDLFCIEDAVASAANYLKRHGWNGDIERKKKALFAYNQSRPYGEAVLAYAEAVKK